MLHKNQRSHFLVQCYTRVRKRFKYFFTTQPNRCLYLLSYSFDAIQKNSRYVSSPCVKYGHVVIRESVVEGVYLARKKIFSLQGQVYLCFLGIVKVSKLNDKGVGM